MALMDMVIAEIFFLEFFLIFNMLLAIKNLVWNIFFVFIFVCVLVLIFNFE